MWRLGTVAGECPPPSSVRTSRRATPWRTAAHFAAWRATHMLRSLSPRPRARRWRRWRPRWSLVMRRPPPVDYADDRGGAAAAAWLRSRAARGAREAAWRGTADRSGGNATSVRRYGERRRRRRGLRRRRPRGPRSRRRRREPRAGVREGATPRSPPMPPPPPPGSRRARRCALMISSSPSSSSPTRGPTRRRTSSRRGTPFEELLDPGLLDDREAPGPAVCWTCRGGN